MTEAAAEAAEWIWVAAENTKNDEGVKKLRRFFKFNCCRFQDACFRLCSFHHYIGAFVPIFEGDEKPLGFGGGK